MRATTEMYHAMPQVHAVAWFVEEGGEILMRNPQVRGGDSCMEAGKQGLLCMVQPAWRAWWTYGCMLCGVYAMVVVATLFTDL